MFYQHRRQNCSTDTAVSYDKIAMRLFISTDSWMRPAARICRIRSNTVCVQSCMQQLRCGGKQARRLGGGGRTGAADATNSDKCSARAAQRREVREI